MSQSRTAKRRASVVPGPGPISSLAPTSQSTFAAECADHARERLAVTSPHVHRRSGPNGVRTLQRAWSRQL